MLTIITHETDLDEDAAFGLTKALVVPMFNAFIERLSMLVTSLRRRWFALLISGPFL